MASSRPILPEDLDAAFNDLCAALPRGVFYRRGSFIAFPVEARQAWLRGVSERLQVPLEAPLGALIGLLKARGFRDDAPEAASGRVGDINRFRQLLGALRLAMEASLDPSAPLPPRLDAWFSSPPLWLLSGFDASHLHRLNPPMARRAAAATPPAGVLPPRTHPQLLKAAGDALAPLLERRHWLFWYDAETRATFCASAPPERGLPDAAALKRAHTREAVESELRSLSEALTASAPHDLNALVFHMLAWIAWSEPVERTPGRPNPGFEPLRHFLSQLAAHKAKQVARKLPRSAERFDDLKAEFLAELILMAQADRFRHVINLNASVRAALDRCAKAALRRARQVRAEPVVACRADAPLDWLVARFGDERAQALQQGAQSLVAHAEARAALCDLWGELRQRLVGLLEEPQLVSVRLPDELRQRCLDEAPMLIAALHKAEPEVLVRWYWLDVLGMDAAELARELHMRDLWLGDPLNRAWFDRLRQDGGELASHRQSLDAQLKRLINEIL